MFFYIFFLVLLVCHWCNRHMREAFKGREGGGRSFELFARVCSFRIEIFDYTRFRPPIYRNF
ncbi:hypothetical protein HanPSC8_Chr17g0791431 [Helianthus annuus]|nr:hypothetical protein HanPSC8_Chr17g0791431 [Helianthus annuus]